MLGAVLLAALLIFGISAAKKHYTLKQMRDLPIQTEKPVEKQEEVQETAEEEEEEEETTLTGREDPVRDFLSEKGKKAIKRIFTKELQIVAIGDSLTEGIGDEVEEGGYVSILEATVNQEGPLIEVENYGKQGNRSDQLLVRMDEPEIEASLTEADIILITIGANDIMKIFKENFTNLSLDKFSPGKISYEERLHQMFTSMEKDNPKADIYLIGFYNPFKKYFADIEELDTIIDEWNAVSAEVAEEYDQTYYIPTKDLFEDTSINYLSDDNFHPNHLGYELMAERVLEYMTNEGEPYDETERTTTVEETVPDTTDD